MKKLLFLLMIIPFLAQAQEGGNRGYKTVSGRIVHADFVDNADTTFLMISSGIEKQIYVSSDLYLENDSLRVNKSNRWDPPLVLSGTTPTWNALESVNADISLSGETTISMTNLVPGMTGVLTIMNATSNYSIFINGYTTAISKAVGTSMYNKLNTTGSGAVDEYAWYYNGTYLVWNGSLEYYISTYGL